MPGAVNVPFKVGIYTPVLGCQWYSKPTRRAARLCPNQCGSAIIMALPSFNCKRRRQKQCHFHIQSHSCLLARHLGWEPDNLQLKTTPSYPTSQPKAWVASKADMQPRHNGCCGRCNAATCFFAQTARSLFACVPITTAVTPDLTIVSSVLYKVLLGHIAG